MLRRIYLKLWKQSDYDGKFVRRIKNLQKVVIEIEARGKEGRLTSGWIEKGKALK